MSFDVAIIGGGFAGACAAHALSGTGARVALIDRASHVREIFRAEKIEPDQAVIMRELGLLGFRAPHADIIGPILSVSRDGVGTLDTGEQYGIDYSSTVNELRAHLPREVEVVRGRVETISPSDTLPEIQFDDGSTVSSRLVVLATGGSDRLLTSLGIERAIDPSLRSLSIGFDIERCDGQPFPFNGLNHHAPAIEAVDYVTIFPVGPRMRVNLFTQLDPKADHVRRIRDSPIESLETLYPGILQHAGPIRAASRVQAVPTVHSRLRRPVRAGVVIVGDEFQGVSPTTGTGLTKVLTDVKVLARHAPDWLASDRLPGGAIRAFYADPEKRRSDRLALSGWMHYRDQARGGASLLVRARNRMQVLGWVE